MTPPKRTEPHRIRLRPLTWLHLRSPRLLVPDLWPLLQLTLAATLSWLIASRVMQHHIPFFAPIASVVALNTALGQRGSNAVRLLVGVGIGIVVSELALWLLGSGIWTFALATFVAAVLARWLESAPLVTAQAAGSAILTLATSTGQGGGPQRLLDAMVGVGVALVFSQVLFPPEPVHLVRRAAGAALREMAEGLRLVAKAYRTRDEKLAGQALARLADLHGTLGELGRSRRAGARVARHSLYWQGRRAAVASEAEKAEQLDLLGGSCLLLARTATPDADGDRGELANRIQNLAGLLATLARSPGSPDIRREVGEAALNLCPGLKQPGASTTIAPDDAVRAVAADLVGFALTPTPVDPPP